MLRNRLLLLFALGLLGLLTVEGYNAIRIRADSLAWAKANLLDQASTVALEQANIVKLATAVLLQLQQSPALARAASGSGDCGQVLSAVGTRELYLSDLMLARPDGEVVCAAIPSAKPRNLAAQAYFKAALASRAPVFGDPVSGQVYDRLALPYAHAMRDSTGRLWGVLVVMLDLSWVERDLLQVPEAELFRLTIFDSHGEIVLRSPDPERWRGKSAFSSAVFRMVTRSGGRGTGEAADLDGVTRIYAFAPFGHSASGELTVVEGRSKRELLSSVERRIGATAAVSVGAILLVFLAIWIGAERLVVDRVLRLTRLATKLGDGDLSARVAAPGGRDELARLGRAFNAMAQNLQSQSAQLAQRTEVLYSTFEHMDQGVTVVKQVNGTLEIVAWNPRFLELLGFPQTLFAGQMVRFEDVLRFNARRGEYGPGDKDEQVRSRLELAQRNEPHCFERLRPDGTALEIRGFPLPEGGFVTTYTDITERKAAQLALQREATRYKALMDTAIDGIHIVDGDGRLVEANAAFLRMHGYQSDEAIGLHVSDWNAQFGHNELQARIKARVSSDAGEVFETRHRCKDGSEFEVESSIVPLELAGTRYLYAASRDISERKKAQRAADKANILLREAVASLGDGFAIYGPDDRLVLCNQRYREIYPATSDIRVPGTTFEEIVRTGAERGQYQAAIGNVEGWVRERLRQHQLADGSPVEQQLGDGRWLLATDHRTPSGHIASSWADITSIKRSEIALRESEELFRELAANVPEMFWVRDAQTHAFIYLSPGAERILGRRLEIGPSTAKEYSATVHPDDYERVVSDARGHLYGGFDAQFRIVRPDGTVRWLHERAFAVRDGAGKVYRVVGIGEDITERKSAEERLQKLARFDPLTSLPNGSFLRDALARALTHEQRDGRAAAVLMVGLDRFTAVNTALGHAAGDALLQQVAARLSDCGGARDIVARIGGDEFALALDGLQRGEDASVVATKVLKVFSMPFNVDERELFLGASIGISIFPDDADRAELLLNYADSAMRRAKTEGRGTFRFYTADTNARVSDKVELETRLHRALERNEFLLHYQPKLELESGAVSGLEALLRWQRPGVGLVPPGDFIPLLEESGLIAPVSEWAIGEACRQITAWQGEEIGPVPVALNLSSSQFRDAGLAQRIARLAREHGISTELLQCEITESSLMTNIQQTIQILSELRAAGIRIAVDDFGTGYSSLAYLRRFPIDALKIDQSFVRAMTSSPDDAAITMTIIQLAHNLGMKVIAEGVENAEQMTFLRLNRCDEIQGYFVSRPVGPTEIATLLREHRA